MIQPAQQPQTKTAKQSDLLLELGCEAYLFHTPDSEAYADIPVKGYTETTPLRSETFKNWLLVAYFKEHGGTPSTNATQEALNTLVALAKLDRPEHEVFLRVGRHDGALYLDMCNQAREVIRVSTSGWEVLPSEGLPVRFRRTAEMLERPLPTPRRGGSVDRLWDVLNVPDKDSRVLITAFLLGMLHPTGPYPGLALYGEQGTAKTSTARYLRQVVDPTSAPVTGDPRDIETVALQAHANWVPVFDNLRTVRDILSDALCRLCTGSAYNKRTHYANTDLTVVKTKRPFMLTSIADAVQQPDLIDRMLVVRLQPIPRGKRRTEAVTDAIFSEAHPDILGGLLDAAVDSLCGHEHVELGSLPRMADFARWVIAAESALGWKDGTFLRVYDGNKTDAYETAINANPVAQAVVSLMDKWSDDTWKGTPTDLYIVLSAQVDDGRGKKPVGWPVNAQKMTDRLNEAAPALRSRGIDVQPCRIGNDRGWRLERLDLVDSGEEEERTVRTQRTRNSSIFEVKKEEEEKENLCADAYVAYGASVDGDDEDDFPDIF